MAFTTTTYRDNFHALTGQGMTAMAPPPLPRRRSCNQYNGDYWNGDFSFENDKPPIALPPLHSGDAPLLNTLELLTPLEPSRPSSPLLEMQQNLLAMQNIISQRILLAKEYSASLVIEGAFRKAEWERGRARRMEQSQRTRSTGPSKNATISSTYTDWCPISAPVVPPAYVLQSSSANRPRSTTTIPLMNYTSAAESSSIESPVSYSPTSSSNMHAASIIQDPLLVASDKVPLTIQHRVTNLSTGMCDAYHAGISVPSSISLNELKQAVWAVMQDGNNTSSSHALGLNGWIERLIVHWDIDKQAYHHFPPTTELRDECLESMLVCLRDVRGYDWVEVGFGTP